MDMIDMSEKDTNQCHDDNKDAQSILILIISVFHVDLLLHQIRKFEWFPSILIILLQQQEKI